MQAKRIALIALAVAMVIGLSALVAALVALRVQPALAMRRPYNTATVVTGVQSLAQLVTVKYVLENVVILDDPQYIAGVIPRGQNRIILLAHGEVKAGVDLSEIGEKDIRISDGKVLLTVPKAKVTDAYLVEAQTQVLDYELGLFTRFTKELEQNARREAVTKLSRAARQSGIEEDANDRAKKQLTHLLQSLGFSQVEIKFR